MTLALTILAYWCAASVAIGLVAAAFVYRGMHDPEPPVIETAVDWAELR